METSEPQYLCLTTKGQTSRRLREIEIWFTRRDERYYVIAEYTSSHWVQNLQADARVQVRVGTKSFGARARVILKVNSNSIAPYRSFPERNTAGEKDW